MKKIIFLSAIFALLTLTSAAQYFRTAYPNETEKAATQFSLYPNPALGQSTLNISGLAGLYIVKVYASTGAPVYSSKESKSVNLPVMNWNTGVYFVIVTNERNEMLYREKLVVKSR